MQAIIALLAAAACVALGALAANRLSLREKMLDAWDGALLRMEGAAARGGSPLPQILRQGAGGRVPLLREAADRLEKEPALSPAALLPLLRWDGLMTPAEKGALEECLLSLFSPNPEAQIRALSYAREQWALFRRVGREAREKNARLYASLGWLSGAALFILMC